jgi:hypothetical protein
LYPRIRRFDELLVPECRGPYVHCDGAELILVTAASDSHSLTRWLRGETDGRVPQVTQFRMSRGDDVNLAIEK